MTDDSASADRPDLVILLLLFALFLFLSPLTTWWASAGLPWYAPFLLWALLIALIAAYDLRASGDDA